MALLLLLATPAGCGPDRIPTSPANGGTSSGAGGAWYEQGTDLPSDLEWDGYAAGSDTLGTIALADYHDPDGSKQVSALLLTEVGAACGLSQQTALELSDKLAGGWTSLGIKVVHLVITNPASEPATVDDALAWKQQWDASWAVGADPSFTFVEEGHNKLPIHVIVNPRTLKMVARLESYRSSFPELEQLAEANQ